MIIFPAIDIKDGKCVRLKQGKADSSTVFYDSPLDAAKIWVDRGSKYLHIVDLDGAFNGTQCNMEIITQIKKETGAYIEVGGGIRDKFAIENIIDKGIDRVILGSVVLKDMNLVKWAAEKFSDKIAVSIDALNDKVAYNGWTGISDIDKFDLIKSLVNIGVNTFIYTDISKDGMLLGPDFEGIRKINETFNKTQNFNMDERIIKNQTFSEDKEHNTSEIFTNDWEHNKVKNFNPNQRVNIIASGGVTSINDIITLKDMNVYGAIIGKALYSGDINIEEALEVI